MPASPRSPRRPDREREEKRGEERRDETSADSEFIRGDESPCCCSVAIMRAVLLAVAVICAAVGCSSTSAAPVLTDAERCARFGGIWSFDSCRSGN